MNIFHLLITKQNPSFKKSVIHYFSKELNLSTLSDYQALRILEDFNKANLLDLEIQKEQIKEKEHDNDLAQEEGKNTTTYIGR